MRTLYPAWRFTQRRHVNILMLHGVMDAESARSKWRPMRPALSPAQLDRALSILSQHYRFVSFEEAVGMLAGSLPASGHCMVVTFDDGYRNNLTHALPILERQRVPATIFLSTGHVTRREPFWYDRMDYALQHLPGPRTVAMGAGSVKVDPADPAGLREAFAHLRSFYKEAAGSHADAMAAVSSLLTDLESQAGRRLADIFESDPWTALLTWGEVERAAAAGVFFGSHTVDHARLDKLDDSELQWQLRVSAEDVAAHTGRPCSLLAYPGGNYSTAVMAAARAAGYTAAVTTEGLANRPRTCNLLALRRNGVSDNGEEISVLATASGLAVSLQNLASIFVR